MFVDVGQARIWYDIQGAGPAIVMLHGNGEDSMIFDEAAAELAKKYTVVRIDSRNHGKSARGLEMSYEAMAQDTAGLIQYLGLEHPALYGFSDGGIVGILVAAHYPELLGALIASGANTRPAGLRTKYLIEFFFKYLRTRDPLLKLMLTQPHIGARTLAQIKTPVLITAGEDDMISLRHTRRLAKSIEGAKLHILSGEEHGSYVVNCARLAVLIEQFLTPTKP